MTDIPNPPFRDMPPLSHIESSDSRFTPLWEQWFLSNRNQINDNTKDIATNTAAITAIQALFRAIFHVGCLFETTNSANPSTYFGFGTWASYGSGRVTVGLDTGDVDFDTVSETGGSKSTSLSDHTHTLGSHDHTVADHVHTITHEHAVGANIAGGADIDAEFSGNSGAAGAGSTGSTALGNTGSSGSGSVSIMPPYVVVYRWRRTA